LDRKVINELNKLTEKNKYVRGLVSWVGFRQEPFPYIRDERVLGSTKYPLAKSIKLGVAGILSFSTKPLSLAIGTGFFSMAISLLLAMYLIVMKILQPWRAVQGWTSIVVIMIFIGGLQLFCIGIVGKYLSGIFEEVKNRPLYVIDKIIHNE
jgi:dolichol-phosphate mannosyltransferase